MAASRLRLQRSPPSPTNTGEQRLIKHAFPPFLCLWEKKTNIAAILAVEKKTCIAAIPVVEQKTCIAAIPAVEQKTCIAAIPAVGTKAS